MNKLLTLLPAAGCMLVMCPLMMMVMMRGRSNGTAPPKADVDEATQLRAEVQQLRNELSDHDDVAS